MSYTVTSVWHNTTVDAFICGATAFSALYIIFLFEKYSLQKTTVLKKKNAFSLVFIGDIHRIGNFPQLTPFLK